MGNSSPPSTSTTQVAPERNWLRRHWRILPVGGALCLPLLAGVIYFNSVQRPGRTSGIGPRPTQSGEPKASGSAAVTSKWRPAFEQPEQARRFRDAVQTGKRASIEQLDKALASARARHADAAYIVKLEQLLAAQHAELAELK